MGKISKVAAVIALALILLSATAAAGGLYARFGQTNKNRMDNARIWHAVICDIEKSIAHPSPGDRKLSADEKRKQLAYFDRLLVRDAHAAPCGITVTGR